MRTFAGATWNAVCERTSGGVIAAGSFAGATVDLNPGDGTFAVSSSEGRALALVELDAAGQFLAAGSLNVHAADVVPNEVLQKPDGSILTAGRFFEGEFAIGPDQRSSSRKSIGDSDAFVAQFSVDAKYQWGWTFGGNGMDTAQSAAVLPGGVTIVAVNSWSPRIDFGKSGHADSRDATKGSAFMAGLDADGLPTGTLEVGPGASISSLRTLEEELFVAGGYAGTTDLDPGTDRVDRKSTGSRAGFLSRYTF